MPWLLYICIFFSDFLFFDMSLLLLTETLRGYLISIAYCLFFHLLTSFKVITAHITTNLDLKIDKKLLLKIDKNFWFLCQKTKIDYQRLDFTQAVVPRVDTRFRHILSWNSNFPLPLIQEELVISYWQKNGHLILVNCFWEACPGTVWLSNYPCQHDLSCLQWT